MDGVSGCLNPYLPPDRNLIHILKSLKSFMIRFSAHERMRVYQGFLQMLANRLTFA